MRPTLEGQRKEAEDKDEEIQQLKKQSAKKETLGFKVDEQGILWYENRI